MIAIFILLVFALCLYGMDWDLRRLRDWVAAEEVAGGECREDDGSSSLGLSATLTVVSSVAGGDAPFDWDTAA